MNTHVPDSDLTQRRARLTHAVSALREELAPSAMARRATGKARQAISRQAETVAATVSRIAGARPAAMAALGAGAGLLTAATPRVTPPPSHEALARWEDEGGPVTDTLLPPDPPSLVERHPLMAGLAAAALGIAVARLLPQSRREADMLRRVAAISAVAATHVVRTEAGAIVRRMLTDTQRRI